MTVPFSSRVPQDLRPSRIAALRERLGALPFDLTVSNPTRCGFAYPERLLDALADPRGLTYAPDPRGDLDARRAVAALYAGWGAAVAPQQVLLTASTSEAYGFLFRLLADPGDEVLVPSPSYPLFEHLARLDGVVARPYRLDPDSGWRVDLPSVASAGGRARAVVVVHPNNPTGSFLHPDDAASLAELCRARGWALVADEVFLPYPLDERALPASLAASADALTFTLGGLSKLAGLPQLKLAWIVASGPQAAVAEALERLEYVADAYLSVSTPVGLAAPRLIAESVDVQRAILDRCRSNLATLLALAPEAPCVTVLPPAGGWTAVLRIPSLIDEEELAIALLEEGVGVHPGYFYDFPSSGWLVVSLLPQPEPFAGGVERLLHRVEGWL